MNTDLNKNDRPFRPTKKLGQNFLTDKNVIGRILDSAELDAKDIIIEVGPGKGALTGRIAAIVNRIYAIEKDTFLYDELVKKYSELDNLIILNEDALCTDFGSFESNSGIKFIANLPYNITSPILSKLTENRSIFSNIIIMIQKEVGNRLASKPGNKIYGALSVMIQTYFDVTSLFTVPPGSFRPKPKVDSVVIKLVPTEQYSSSIKDPKLYEQVVKASFSSRRKMIVNALKSGFDREDIDICLKNAGINGKNRAEDLSVLQFIQLSNSFYQLQQTASSESRSF